MTKTEKGIVKAVKLCGDKKSAVYAITLDGVRCETFRLFMDRVYRNSKMSGKGVRTVVRVLDMELHHRLFEAKASIEEFRKTEIVRAGTVAKAVAKLQKIADAFAGVA